MDLLDPRGNWNSEVNTSLIPGDLWSLISIDQDLVIALPRKTIEWRVTLQGVRKSLTVCRNARLLEKTLSLTRITAIKLLWMVWKLYNDLLPTKDKRASKNVTVRRACTFCPKADESIKTYLLNVFGRRGVGGSSLTVGSIIILSPSSPIRVLKTRHTFQTSFWPPWPFGIYGNPRTQKYLRMRTRKTSTTASCW